MDDTISREWTPLPTSRGIEHISLTVSDLDEASDFFIDMFGCQILYTMGPFSGTKGSFMRVYANTDVRAVVHNVRVLRSPFLNIELLHAEYPKQRPLWPDFLDLGGWHLTGYVDDIDAAIDYVSTRDVFVLGQGKKLTGGPEAGDGAATCHFMTPWGFRFELLTYPNGRDYEATRENHLWNPARPDRGAAASFQPGPGGVPTFRGFEHVSFTVPDLDEASDLLVNLLGCEAMYDLEPSIDRHSSAFGAYANVDARAAPSRVRLLRCHYLNIEVVECPEYPGQNRLWPGMLDVGGWHLAFYVDDVDIALDHLAKLDIRVLGGKKPAALLESGEDAYTVHCISPFGLYFELVTYPNGRARADEHADPPGIRATPTGELRTESQSNSR